MPLSKPLCMLDQNQPATENSDKYGGTLFTAVIVISGALPGVTRIGIPRRGHSIITAMLSGTEHIGKQSAHGWLLHTPERSSQSVATI